MSNTYSQLYIHIIFSVKSRAKLIRKEFREELHKYISGIVQNLGHKLIAINCMPDHVHIFTGIKPDIAISDLVRDIKSNSGRFINQNRWVKGKFHWQEGFGAFSCSHSQLGRVIRYIDNQEKHHKKKTFKEEYLELLKNYNVTYDNRYVFD